MNIPINKIIYLYEIIGKDIPDDFKKDVEKRIEDEQEEQEDQKENNKKDKNDSIDSESQKGDESNRNSIASGGEGGYD